MSLTLAAVLTTVYQTPIAHLQLMRLHAEVPLIARS
jgi:hypothetical protein